MRTSFAFATLLLSVSACSSSPENVAGSYTISLTKHDNGCNFANWVVGDVATNIPVTITQEDDSASADVEGAGGTFLQVALGSKVYNGSVDGSHVDLTIVGTTPQSTGNCAYTYDSSIEGDLAGDTLSGNLEFAAQTNAGSDCAQLTGCVSVEAFNGTRPPQ